VDEDGKHIQQMGQAVWLFLYLIVHKDRETSRLVRKYETIAGDMKKTPKTIQLAQTTVILPPWLNGIHVMSC